MGMVFGNGIRADLWRCRRGGVVIAHCHGHAARKVGQYAARKVDHPAGGFILRLLLTHERNRLVGMWESRVLCEISKRLWKSVCDSIGASFPQPRGCVFVVTSWPRPLRG